MQEAEAALHAPHGTPMLGPHGDEAVHVLLVLGHVGVPHLGAGQTAARHAAGQLLLWAHPEVRAREGEAKAAHLIHECGVNDSRGCAQHGLGGGGEGGDTVGVEVLHLFRLGDFIKRAGREINFYFWGLCVKDVCSVLVNGELEIFELLGDDALDGLNLLLVLHALVSIEDITRWSLKDSLAPVNDAKDATVEFLLELLRCPVPTALDRTAEPSFGIAFA